MSIEANKKKNLIDEEVRDVDIDDQHIDSPLDASDDLDVVEDDEIEDEVDDD